MIRHVLISVALAVVLGACRPEVLAPQLREVVCATEDGHVLTTTDGRFLVIASGTGEEFELALGAPSEVYVRGIGCLGDAIVWNGAPAVVWSKATGRRELSGSEEIWAVSPEMTWALGYSVDIEGQRYLAREHSLTTDEVIERGSTACPSWVAYVAEDRAVSLSCPELETLALSTWVPGEQGIQSSVTVKTTTHHPLWDPYVPFYIRPTRRDRLIIGDLAIQQFWAATLEPEPQIREVVGSGGHVRLSEDGSRGLAFEAGELRTFSWEQLDGETVATGLVAQRTGEPRRSFLDQLFRTSSDGRYAAYHLDGDPRLHVQDVTSGAPAIALEPAGDQPDRVVPFTRDGDFVLYDTEDGVWAAPSAGGDETRFLGSGITQMAALDGSRIVYTRPVATEGVMGELLVQDLSSGSEPTIVSPRVHLWEWLVRDDRIYFNRATEEGFELVQADL